MGEFIRLSYEECKRVVRIVSEEAGGRPILAGVAEPNVNLVLKMCRYCADLGCRAVSITGPYYYKLTQELHGGREEFRPSDFPNKPESIMKTQNQAIGILEIQGLIFNH